MSQLQLLVYSERRGLHADNNRVVQLGEYAQIQSNKGLNWFERVQGKSGQAWRGPIPIEELPIRLRTEALLMGVQL